MALQSLAGIKEGSILSYWHDSGCFGAQLAFARVVKIGAKKVKVVGEGRREDEARWKYPWFFHEIVSEKTVAELRADGVEI